MKAFKNEQDLIAAKAKESLKAYASDQSGSIDWSFSGLRQEIIKERAYQAKKVQRQFHPHSAAMNNVQVAQPYIKNFGVVKI